MDKEIYDAKPLIELAIEHQRIIDDAWLKWQILLHDAKPNFKDKHPITLDPLDEE